MAKKLIDIQNYINQQAIPFRKHIYKELSAGAISFINELTINFDVYIFSGVIRNYFLKRVDLRDLDIVVEGSTNLDAFLEPYDFKKNSFGGYKLKVEQISIDLWYLKNTWALKVQPSIDYNLERHIPNTAFFNFSSILFSLKDDKFYFTKHFTKFIRDKKIDLVYEPNASVPLCVINSIYYSDKLNLPIGDTLITYLKSVYKKYNEEYEQIQLKHFGQILYPKQAIIERINILETTPIRKKQIPRSPYPPR